MSRPVAATVHQHKRPASDTEYPESEGRARPFHLWDANAHAALRWRYYSDPKRAHMAALIEARWSKVGTVIEVFNASTGKLLGQYRRHVDTVKFYEA